MKDWILDFKWPAEGYDAEVDEEVKAVLEEHPYLGISFEADRALQFFSGEQVEELNAKLMPKDDEGNLRHSRRMAARIIFSEMLQVDFSDGEPLRIPHSLASFIRMEEWTLPLGILSEDNGKVLLRESGFEF